MTSSACLERPANRALEIAEIPHAGRGPIEARGNLLELNQVVQQALPELVDVYK